MLARTDLAPVPIRGPKAPPLLGPFGGVLRFFANPVRSMLAMHRDYGDLVAVADGNPALVCAFGAAHNRAVITQPQAFEHLTEVPIRIRPGSALAHFNDNVIFMNGAAHQRRRRLLMPAFTRAAVEGYAPAMAEVAQAMTARWPLDREVDLASMVRDLTASIALRCLLGIRSTDGADVLGRMESELLATIASPLLMLLPFDLPGTPYGRAMRLAEGVEARIRQIIAERRRDPQGTDALSRLLAARDEDGSALSEDELVGECNNLFAAGYDTSANTLTWTLLLLAAHPDVLDAVDDEIRAVLRGEPPAVEHLPALGLLERVLKESKRLLPTAVLLFMRICREGARLGDVELPAGAHVMLSPIVTHRDPHVFPAPQRFLPDRWKGHEHPPYTYLPFGAGPRACLGASFASVALRLALASILQRARPVLPSGARVDYMIRGPAMCPKGGLRMRLLRPGSRAPRPRVRGTITTLVDFA